MNPAPEPMRFTPWNVEQDRPLRLAMQELRLAGEVLPVGARLVVRHVFRSAEAEPIEVVYPFPLPRDAALRRFRVEGEGFSVRSELRPAREAERGYEQAIDEGHLAAIARVHRDGIVNLAVGNLRPGETVAVVLELVAGVEARDDGFRFRFPFTLAPGYHPRAVAASPAPGAGEILLPEDEFDGLLLPEWRDWADGLHRVDLDLAVHLPGAGWSLASPSHDVETAPPGEPGGTVRVRLPEGGTVPDRDLVLDARTARPEPVILAGTDPAGRGRFAAVIPSRALGEARDDRPRRVVFVLDRSGSMQGRPLAAARRALAACLAALREGDAFALVAFDTETERFAGPEGLLPATRENVEQGRRFLERIEAGGGTEILRGLARGAELLGEAGGDLLLVTDGQVHGTEEVVAGMARRGVRVHALGIGSAARDRFLEGLARATGGTSRAVGPREDVAAAVRELFAATGALVAEDLRVEVAGLPGARLDVPPPATVPAGIPLVVLGSVPGVGRGTLRLRFRGGSGAEETRELPLHVPAEGPLGETIALLAGARRIADLEAAAADLDGVRGELEAIGRDLGLASRAMSLVAVVAREGDMPGRPPVTRIVAVGLPEDVDGAAYFPLFEAHRALPAHRDQPSLGFYLDASHLDGRPRHASLRPMELAHDRVGPRIERFLEKVSRFPSPAELLRRGPELREAILLLRLLAATGLGRGVLRHHERRLRQLLEATLLEGRRFLDRLERLRDPRAPREPGRDETGEALLAALALAGRDRDFGRMLREAIDHLAERLGEIEQALHANRHSSRGALDPDEADRILAELEGEPGDPGFRAID